MKAVSSTTPWNMLLVTRPPLPLLEALVNGSPPPSTFIAPRAFVSSSTRTSLLCCRDTLLSASSTVTVARGAGQRRLVPPLTQSAAYHGR